MRTGDTIAAVSSAIGLAGRVIVRVSGSKAFAIASLFVSPWESDFPIAAFSSLRFVDLQCPAWVYAFASPRSYTGEDLVEFHLPGSPILANLLLNELFKHNVRLAEPGEFTARAFFAGKLTLTQAEGVAAAIAASNEQELRAARQLMAGELARRLEPSMELLAQTLALIEVGIDFSEEDVSFLPTAQILDRLRQIDSDLEQLLDDSDRFEQLTHEPRIVLVGRPNAGKSTLINALSGEDRSVVSDIAGTTRDILSADVDLPHGRVKLIDVAGIETDFGNEIEQAMQAQAGRAIESGDRLVLVRDVMDSSEPISIKRAFDLTVISKVDLSRIGSDESPGTIGVSALTGKGMLNLREALDRLAFDREGSAASLALNRRHIQAIDDARAAITRAEASTRQAASELIALELREALDSLGSVLGTITPDDVLGRVFSSFCIGK